MKTSIVPAQITSVEDVIAANLSLTQIIILIIPVFMAALIFSGLPPFMHIKLYKLIILFVICLPISLLALRINGQIILKWLAVIVAYKTRPRVYLFSQQNSCDCLAEVVASINENGENAISEPERTFLRLLPKQDIEITAFLKSKSVSYVADKEGRLNAIIEAK